MIVYRLRRSIFGPGELMTRLHRDDRTGGTSGGAEARVWLSQESSLKRCLRHTRHITCDRAGSELSHRWAPGGQSAARPHQRLTSPDITGSRPAFLPAGCQSRPLRSRRHPWIVMRTGLRWSMASLQGPVRFIDSPWVPPTRPDMPGKYLHRSALPRRVDT